MAASDRERLVPGSGEGPRVGGLPYPTQVQDEVVAESWPGDLEAERDAVRTDARRHGQGRMPGDVRLGRVVVVGFLSLIWAGTRRTEPLDGHGGREEHRVVAEEEIQVPHVIEPPAP